MKNLKLKPEFTELERKKIIDLSCQTLYENSAESNEALAYLHGRGITNDVIKRFSFGYFPNRLSNFPKLRGCIIMPLIDQYGQEIAITRRDFRTDDKEFKHWHESFDKGRYLYGLNIAKDAIIANNKAIVVEGQFDIVRLHTNNIPMTVAIIGSSFRMEHVVILCRYCSEIYLAFDNDASGISNTKRAMSLYKEKQMDQFGLKIVPVPISGAKDPDEFIGRFGRKDFISLLSNSKKNLK